MRVSPNLSGLARPSDPPPPRLPWVLPYREDPASADRYLPEEGRVVLRPILDVSLAARFTMTSKVWALVDSGSEHTLASPGIARAVGLEERDSFREIPLGIGGDTVPFWFADVTIRVHWPDGPLGEYYEWETEIGFGGRWRAPWPVLLGQVGFFSEFTVTPHRFAQALAVEELDLFDQRYGATVAPC